MIARFTNKDLPKGESRVKRPLMRLLAACAAAPTLCMALPLSDYMAAPGDTMEIYLAGASAQDIALERLFRLQCEAESLDIYRAGGNQRALFCRIATTETGFQDFPQHQKVVLYKSSVGGSGNGVGPLVIGYRVEFINLGEMKAHAADLYPANRQKSYPAEKLFAEYTEHQCTNPKPAFALPDVGISDVEPILFARNYGLDEERLKVLDVRSANAVIFGVPVSLALRDALQAAQFPVDHHCHPQSPKYTASAGIEGRGDVSNVESEACMPSLSRVQIASIFSGMLTQWDKIVNARGYPLAAQNVDAGQIQSPPTVTPPSDSRIFLCRRVDTSGTQASYELFFLGDRCIGGVRGFAPASTTVTLGSGTSDVKKCLNDRHESNRWAVGIFSTENVAKLEQDNWRFIRMDGVAPTLINTFNGRWPFFVEQTIQWRGERSGKPLRGWELKLIERIAREAGNPTVIAALNQGFRHSWGDGGVMALNTNGFQPPLPRPEHPVNESSLRENPVLPVTHAPMGYPNNCNPALATFPTVALRD